MIALFVLPSVAAGPLQTVDDMNPLDTTDGIIETVVMDGLVVALLTMNAAGCSVESTIDSGRVPMECVTDYRAGMQDALGHWIRVRP